MAAISLTVKNSDLPVWLPTPQDLVLMCELNGEGPLTLTLHSPDGSEAAFVKYGPTLAMGEARTQDYVADHVNSDKHLVVLVPRIYYAFRYEEIGYITMQYVDGNDCNQNDLDTIALAVNRLRAIPSPTVSPGPVGGGMITHRFFSGHRSSVQYDSVEDLQEHVNKVSAFYSSYRLLTQVKLDSHLGKIHVSRQLLRGGRWKAPALP
jgi:hypothetical protein